MQSDFFIRRYYVLNKVTKTMTIHEKPNGKAQHTLNLGAMLQFVDTKINTVLLPDYSKHFEENVRNLVLPKDNPLPFALYVKG